MNITEFISKPTVKKLQVTSEEIVAAYGEPLEFNIMLPMPVEDYAMLSKLSQAEFVAKMLVDAEGKQVITEGKSLSPFLIGPISTVIWVELGKLPEKFSIQSPSQSS